MGDGEFQLHTVARSAAAPAPSNAKKRKAEDQSLLRKRRQKSRGGVRKPNSAPEKDDSPYDEADARADEAMRHVAATNPRKPRAGAEAKAGASAGALVQQAGEVVQQERKAVRLSQKEKMDEFIEQSMQKHSGASITEKPAEPKPQPAPVKPKPVSRKNPAMISDGVYSAFHLSAHELSRKRGAATDAPVANAGRSKRGGDASSFSSLGFDDRLALICTAPRERPVEEEVEDEEPAQKPRTVRGLGLATPTAVQAESARFLLAKKNALIVAPTGSGKTLAYILPVLQSLHNASPKLCRADGTAALVLAPTRELCAQIEKVATAVATRYDISIVVGSVSGGEKRKAEKARLRKGVTLLVATPGRLVDHLGSTESLGLGRLEWLVLDEVDRLLDLGFGPQVDEVCTKLKLRAKAGYATALVTATLSSRLSELASKHLGREHAVVQASGTFQEDRDLVTSSAARLFTPATLRQRHAIVTLKLRLAALCATLAAHPQSKTLVFVSTCAAAEVHAALLARDEARPLWEGGELAERAPRSVGRLHGSMERTERKGAYDDFCASNGGVLFATDVAARGVDFDEANVDYVVHLDAPRDVATYVHRSGRCARAGRDGVSILLLLPTERPLLDAIARRTGNAPQRAPLALRDDRAAQDAARTLEKVVLKDADLTELAQTAFSAHMRAYAAKPNNVRECDDEEVRLLRQAFHLRSLHLGHAAKAFGLTETPSRVGRNLASAKVKAEKIAKRKLRETGAKKKKAPSVGSNTRNLQRPAARRTPRADQISEFNF
ncbi:P-loop containing nucleoside triphosphate hydrolase protein [Pelagophyceae sp. CCMP2097]|nr:P-loop containing nucleoside triphosphate hydrolase protein [Pelagophyceae sp. CCMP2097]